MLGSTAQGIVYATARGNDTVISGGVASGGTNVSAAWLSTDGGSTWTAVTIPVDHGADSSLVGLGFDGSGLIAVWSGVAAAGGPDGVTYFPRPDRPGSTRAPSTRTAAGAPTW